MVLRTWLPSPERSSPSVDAPLTHARAAAAFAFAAASSNARGRDAGAAGGGFAPWGAGVAVTTVASVGGAAVNAGCEEECGL